MKQHRAEYYRLLDEVRLQGDWEAWVEFFLEGVAQTAGAAVATAHRLLTLFREDEGRISGQGRKSSSLLRLFAALRSRPLTTITDLSRRSGLSFPTAATGAEALVLWNRSRATCGARTEPRAPGPLLTRRDPRRGGGAAVTGRGKS